MTALIVRNVMNRVTGHDRANKPIRSVRAVVHAVNNGLLGLSAVAIVVMLASILTSVAYRYFLDDPLVWANDVSRIALTVCFFAAVAPALERGAHVAVEFDAQRFPPPMLLGLNAARWVVVAVVVVGWFVMSFELVGGAIEDGRPVSGLFIEVPAAVLYVFQSVCLLQFGLTAIASPLRGSSPQVPND